MIYAGGVWRTAAVAALLISAQLPVSVLGDAGTNPANPDSGDPNNPDGGDGFDGGDPNNPDGGDPNNPDGGDGFDGGDPNNPDGGDPNNPPGGDPNNPNGGDSNNPDGGDPNNPDGGDAAPVADDGVDPMGGTDDMPDGSDAAADATATADGPAGAPVEATGPILDEWQTCAMKLESGEAESNAIADIYGGAFVQDYNNGQAPSTEPLVGKASPQTLSVLTNFDLAGSGFTAVVSKDMVTNHMADGPDAPPMVSLEELYNVTFADVPALDANRILHACVIQDTLSFAELDEMVTDTANKTYTSLQGFEWTFIKVKGDNNSSFLAIKDDNNITSTGYFEIKPDIRQSPDCPNSIIGIDGFIPLPKYLEPDAITADAPALEGPIPQGLSTATEAMPPLGADGPESALGPEDDEEATGPTESGPGSGSGTSDAAGGGMPGTSAAAGVAGAAAAAVAVLGAALVF